MGKIIVFLGAPGAGKSVQAEAFARRHSWYHLSSGELLRHNPQLIGRMATGELISSAETERVVDDAIRSVPVNTSIILDGFPRMLEEAVWLEARVSSWQRTICAVIFLNVDAATCDLRLSARHRSDDTQTAREERRRIYLRETLPVIAHYRTLGLLEAIDGRGSLHAVGRRIDEACL